MIKTSQGSAVTQTVGVRLNTFFEICHTANLLKDYKYQ